MVDISTKVATVRRARAEAIVRLRARTRQDIESDQNPKGSVLGVARIAGIQGAKETSRLIPLCHPLPIDNVRVDFEWIDGPGVAAGEALLRIEAEVVVTARTGIEMEALTAVAVAALTVHDMCKGADPAIVIDGIRLLEKTGGKSDFKAR